MADKISRRDFIKATILGVGAAILAACKRVGLLVDEPVATRMLTKEPTETKSPTKTPTATTQPMETTTPSPTPTETGTPTPTPTPTEKPCLRLLSPEDGAHLPAMGKVIFAWEPMPEAATYKLVITFPTEQFVVFETVETSRGQYIEVFHLGGVYHWQVTALDADGNNICTAEPFSFEKPEYIPPSLTPKPPQKGNGSGGNGTPAPTQDSCNPWHPGCPPPPTPTLVND